MTNADKITDLEAFHNSYHYYIESVKAIAMEPAEACAAYGNFNVGTELQMDCGPAGVYLLNNPACTFTDQQRDAVASLAKHLEGLPLEARRFTDVKSESITRMQHPAWVPLRTEARALLQTLQSATDLTAQYFSGRHSAA